LAWQSYGDAAIANSRPQLGWLAPQAAPIAHNAPDMIALAAQAAPSPDQQQLDAISLDLDAVRQSIDRIATSIAAGQEQMTRSVDQLAAGQEQMTREITKLQAVEPYVLYKTQSLRRGRAPAPARPPRRRASGRHSRYWSGVNCPRQRFRVRDYDRARLTGSRVLGFFHLSHRPARLSTPPSAALMKYGCLPSDRAIRLLFSRQARVYQSCHFQ
jgi:hypothetical protein